MKAPTKKLLNATRRYNKAQQEYYVQIHQYIRTAEVLDNHTFWKYLEALSKNIRDRMHYGGDAIKEGVHNTILEIARDVNTRVSSHLQNWLASARFLATYRHFSDKLGTHCWDMPGVCKSDDSYGDWIDALPLAGKTIVNDILRDELANLSFLTSILTKSKRKSGRCWRNTGGKMELTDGQLIALVVLVAAGWVFFALGTPKLFPTGRWSDLRRFFKKRKR